MVKKAASHTSTRNPHRWLVHILFVDDRVKNLASAAAVGIQTVHYNYSDNGDSGGHPSIARLAAILEQ